ncbi:hypothetical protein PENSTE_c002G04760 [Penicillium steckii]|uniref:Uncharacterized protein n=1 Tax=Penicillium steckii TaxID=303698 RepID=A0A1V6TUF1_9EURO|nr:hypothetical protein PENSTE_c002G04760 [Penicillium steckii]
MRDPTSSHPPRNVTKQDHSIKKRSPSNRENFELKKAAEIRAYRERHKNRRVSAVMTRDENGKMYVSQPVRDDKQRLGWVVPAGAMVFTTNTTSLWFQKK